MKFLRAEILKAIIACLIPAVLSLCILCIVTIYQSYGHMASSGREALLQTDKDTAQIKLLGEFINDTSPIMDRSLDRGLQLDKIITYKKMGTANQQISNSLRMLSANARLEAAKDLAHLDRYSEDTVPQSTPLKDGLKNLLNSEISLWEKVDKYLISNSVVRNGKTNEDEDFQAFTDSFLEFLKSVHSVQALDMQMSDRILMSKKEAQSKHEEHVAELDQTRRRFKLAFAGLIVTFLSISIFTFVLSYPPLGRRLIHFRKRSRARRKS